MNFRKYLVMGSQNCNGDPAPILETAIESGITAFQFREKGDGSLTGDAKLKLGIKLRSICSRHNIPFIVNDDLFLVKPLEADGIHVGQDDHDVREVRASFPYKIIGLSVSNQAEVARSPIDLVDYLGAGPIFHTPSKDDAKKPVGPGWIKQLRIDYPHKPIVGIGGINESNAASIMDSGANGVAVISAITRADDIYKSIRKL
ncbi:thiamine phosphate synthase [Virgibacillus doumboii]|uniref:thiamine phosphate synthase n=1 Tax=Virgibacillus doumboii TaxID=2697503 RepID=UPI0013DF3A0C|nr:thiamine phosphate synthase [Virgibacillus doumboii]